MAGTDAARATINKVKAGKFRGKLTEIMDQIDTRAGEEGCSEEEGRFQEEGRSEKGASPRDCEADW